MKIDIATSERKTTVAVDLAKPITKGGVLSPFPWQLYDCLEEISKDGLDDIISWKPHGRAFTVHKQDAFAERIMHRFFKQTRFASFQRQLNLYGFIRIHSGEDKGSYYHLCFVRGQKKLLRQIVRQKIKGSRIQKAAPQDEPNFYLPEWENHTEASIPPALRKKSKKKDLLSTLKPTHQVLSFPYSSSKILEHHASKDSSLMMRPMKSESGNVANTASPLFHPTLMHPFFCANGSSINMQASCLTQQSGSASKSDMMSSTALPPAMQDDNDLQYDHQTRTDNCCKSLLSQALLECTDIGGEGFHQTVESFKKGPSSTYYLDNEGFSLEELEPIPLREDRSSCEDNSSGQGSVSTTSTTAHPFTLVDPERNMYLL